MGTTFDQLALLTEIGVTLLGFIAVFFILSGGTGKFSPDDTHFIHAMVLTASLLIVAAIGPRTTASVTDADHWRAWSIAGFALSLVLGAVVAWKQYDLAFEEVGGMSAWWHVPGWTIGLCGAGAWGAASFGVVPADGWYLIGTTLYLLNAIWCFVAVVFRKCF